MIDITSSRDENGRPPCSGCGGSCRLYHRSPARLFEFATLSKMVAILVDALWRTNCPRCSMPFDRVPWNTGKQHPSAGFERFLVCRVRRLN